MSLPNLFALEVVLFALFSLLSHFIHPCSQLATVSALHLLLTVSLDVLSAVRRRANSAPTRFDRIVGSLRERRNGVLLLAVSASLICAVPSAASSLVQPALVVLVLLSHKNQTASANNSIDTGEEKAKSNVPKKYMRDEGSRLLDAIEQGYFMCRRVAELDPTSSFSVIFTNRKARELTHDVEGGVNELFERLNTLEDLPRSLRQVVVDVLENRSIAGTCTKVRLGIQLRRKDSDSGSSLAGEDRSRRSCGSFGGCQQQNTYKIVPFKYFKASIWRISGNDAVVVMEEQCPTGITGNQSERNTAIACTLTHELRTITNGIIGNIQLSEEDPTGDCRMRKVHHEIALCSSYLLVDRLNDFFDYMQLNNRGFKPHYTQFALEEIFQHIQQIVQPLAHERQLGFSIECRDRLPATFVGDKMRLQQILVNVTMKTLEFTDNGAVCLQVKVAKDKSISFSITSKGKSMHEKLDRIIKESSDTALGKKRSSTSIPTPTTAESSENLEALSLQITQLICKELGTSIVAKSSEGNSTQLKFKIRDRFSEHPINARPLGFDRELRRCSTNWREKKTEPAPFEFYKPDRIVNLEGMELAPASVVMFSNATPIKQSEKTKEIDNEEIQFTDELPNEAEGAAGKLPVPSPPKKCSTINVMRAGTLMPSLKSHAQIPSKMDDPFPEMERIESGAKAHSPIKSRRTTALGAPNFTTEVKYETVDDAAKCKVLIVDDNTINRFVLKGLMKKHGYNSIEARDGKEAVTLIERYNKAGMLGELKLIFMDLQMPVMNGTQATGLIRKICPSLAALPIIGVSSDPVETDRVRFVQAGLNEFMNKPVDNTKIYYAIQKYILGRR